MTRADLFDWLLAHKCTIEPLSENTRGNTVKIKSPRSNSYIFYNTPIDDTPLKCYSVCHICKRLYVPIPKPCEHMEEVANHVEKNHYPHNSNKGKK